MFHLTQGWPVDHLYNIFVPNGILYALQAEADDRGSAHAAARILFVSESNVCRSPLAVAAMQALLQGSDLAQLVECESKVRIMGPSLLLFYHMLGYSMRTKEKKLTQFQSHLRLCFMSQNSYA